MELVSADLVAIRVCADVGEAHVHRALLASEGIDCYVQGEHHRSMLGMVGPYVELRLMVAERDAERALEVLASAGEPRLPSDLPPELAPEPIGLPELSLPPQRSELQARSGAERPKLPQMPLILAMVLSFGFGHMYAGAWLRGAGLFVVQAVAVYMSYTTGSVAAILAIPLVVAVDSLGGYFAVQEHNAALERSDQPLG